MQRAKLNINFGYCACLDCIKKSHVLSVLSNAAENFGCQTSTNWKIEILGYISMCNYHTAIKLSLHSSSTLNSYLVTTLAPLKLTVVLTDRLLSFQIAMQAGAGYDLL